jgi:hypothetical protein
MIFFLTGSALQRGYFILLYDIGCIISLMLLAGLKPAQNMLLGA